MNMLRPGQEAALSALLALAAVGAALLSQHGFDMQPCPWCVLQRLVFLMGAGAALGELALGTATRGQSKLASNPASQTQHPKRAAFTLRSLALLRLLLAACGLAAATWQHLVASASASCNLTWADRILAWTQLDALLPDIFQPRASCLDAKAWIIGVPYELWSAALFTTLGALALRSLMAYTRFTGSSKA
jgi:disulfide bond formation protein DsbB